MEKQRADKLNHAGIMIQKDHQGVDAVAQIPTPPQGHCPAAGSCQRPVSSKVISFVLH